MCTFLTVAVEARRQQALISALRAMSLEVEAQRNPSVAALFASNEALLLVTHGDCSCDLGSGLDVSPEDRAGERAEALRRRGLTPGQVKRALATPPRPVGPNSALRQALDAVLRDHAPVRLLFQQVSRDPQTEPVTHGEQVEAGPA